MLKYNADTQETWKRLSENASLLDVDFQNYLKALEVFLSHPQTQNCKTSFAKVMGYMACPSEASLFPEEYSQIVKSMLDQFGFANE
ncbi:MAG: hypothetical protein AAGA18_12795 [Verrucomicrobiota bacterium]